MGSGGGCAADRWVRSPPASEAYRRALLVGGAVEAAGVLRTGAPVACFGVVGVGRLREARHSAGGWATLVVRVMPCCGSGGVL